jgi:hypothetical protein
MPYSDGLALYAEGDRYRIPAVTFTSFRNEMFVGCLNVEGQIPHQVCLLPDITVSSAGLVVLIASNTRFFQRTVPRLCEQLGAAGLSRTQIKVVVNESSENRDEVIDGVAYAFTTHAAWEFSALCEAPRRFEFHNAFLLHDTCMVEPHFLERVLSLNGALPWDHSPACIYGRTCIGMYSREYLERIHDWLSDVDKISKPDAIIAECAAEFIQRAHRACAYGGEITWGADCPDVWSTGLRRHHRLFPQLGVHKFTTLNLAYSHNL